MVAGERINSVICRCRLHREVLAGALSFGATLLPSFGHAAQSARLVYSRGPDAQRCPAEEGLRRAVAGRLGYDPFVAVSNRTVVAEIRLEAHGLAARVYVIGDGGTSGGARQLAAEDRDCTELLAAVALAISIAIDPDAMDRMASDEPANPEPEKAQSTTPEKPPPSSTLATVSPLVSAPPQPADPAAIAGAKPEKPPTTAMAKPLPREIGAFASIATGPTPAPTLATGLGFALAYGRLGLVLEPKLLLPSTSQPRPEQVRVYGYGANVGLGLRASHWFGGLIGSFDFLVSEGKVANPRTDHSWTVASGPRFAYRQAIGNFWFLVVNVDGLIALRTVDMRVDGKLIYEMPHLMLRGGIAVNYAW